MSRRSARAVVMLLVALVALPLGVGCGGGDGSASGDMARTDAATASDMGFEGTDTATVPPSEVSGPLVDVPSPDGGVLPPEDASRDLLAVEDDASEPLPPPICTAGTRWTPGTPIFVERTEEWGFAAAGVEGTRINIIDADGDGWADVLVRRGGTHADDLAPGGTRYTWLLRNQEGSGFVDMTLASGMLAGRGELPGRTGRPGQVYAAADVDNDGDLDLYSGAETADSDIALGETSEILLNDGSGGFALGPATSDVRRAGEVDMPAGASFVDFDRDGLIDLWIGEHNYSLPDGKLVFQQDRLYRGDGTGAFADVSEAAGVTSQDWLYIGPLNEGLCHTRAWSAAACDLNGDGVTELLVASYGRSPNHLWQGAWNEGSPSFTNRSVDSGYAYDDDLTWTDNQFAACYCRSNPDAEGCDEAEAPQIACTQANWTHSQDREPFRLGGNSAATLCADIDNDGDIDLLTTEIRHWWAGTGADGSEVLVNDGAPDVHFTRPGDEALGLAVPHDDVAWDEGHMSATVFDFDNDGWPDIYLGASDYPGNRGLLYHQDVPLDTRQGAALRFTEVATAEFFEHNRSHGVAVADLDRDGDLDIVVGHSRARCDASAPNDCYPTSQVRVFENVLGDGGNWLQLALEGGEDTNRAAIGARVTVVAGGVTMTREVGGGYGHYGAQDDLIVHVGLGAACEAEVAVRWPDRALSTEQETLGAGHRYRWRQGAGVTLAD